MYTSIYELPTQVTSSLDARDSTKWMDTFNRTLGDKKSKADIDAARKAAWKAVRNAPTSFSFCIKASVEDVDKDREIIDLDSIRRHMDSYISYGGNLIIEHGNYVVGTIWDWAPFKENGLDGVKVWGNLFGGDKVYDQTRAQFIDGRNNLSIAGEATEGAYQCDARGCYTRRKVKQLMEISLCDVPANRHATMVWYNKDAKLTKSSKDEIRLSVEGYELHRDYTTCPIQALKKSLLDCGYGEAHAKPDGVYLPMDDDEVDAELTSLFAKGYGVEAVEGGLMVRDHGKARERMFKSMFDKGVLDGDGYVTPSASRSEFKALFDLGYIGESDGRYRFRRAPYFIYRQ